MPGRLISSHHIQVSAWAPRAECVAVGYHVIAISQQPPACDALSKRQNLAKRVEMSPERQITGQVRERSRYWTAGGGRWVMQDTGPVVRALAELEQIHADLASITTRTDDGRLRDLIEYRRRLAERIANLGREAEPMFQSLSRPDLLQTYRQKFSKMRSAAAIHQANWPAVRLNEANDEYYHSIAAVHESNHDFVDWMRATLSRI